MTTFGLIVTIAFAQNVVLVNFLGFSPFEPPSRSVRRAHQISVTIAAVLLVIATLHSALVRLVLLPLGWDHVELLVLALIVGMGQIVFRRIAVFVAPFSVRWISEVGPLVVVNATVFGVATVTARLPGPFYLVPVAAIAAGIGVYLALVPLAAIRQRLSVTDLPASFSGDSTVFISAGIMSLVITAVDQTLFVLFPPIW